MTSFDFLLLLLASGLAVASPGPSTLAIAGASMQRGRAAGLTLAAGIVCGSATWGTTAALGMSAVMLANVWLVEVLRYAGAAYLLFLAVRTLKSGFTYAPLTQVQPARGGLRRLFAKGLLIHLTNPKAIFSWGAIFAVAVPPGSEPWVILQAFLALAAVSYSVFFGYALLFSTATFVRTYQRLRRILEIGFGAMFGAAAVRILTARLT